MPDGTVGVRQAPDADRLIDNNVVTNGNGETVYRQKVDAVGAATEVTLAAVRTAVEAVNANTDAVETLLTAIRDTTYRRTDPLPAGSNQIGIAGTVPGMKVAQGRFFLAGSGRVTLAAAGNLRGLITNPTGSGRTVSVVRFAGFATATGYAQLFLNPTTGLPATAARPIANAVMGGGLAPVASLTVDTNLTTALSGGTDLGLVIGIPGNSRTSIDFPPVVLSPGVSLGLNVPFAGAADSTLSIYWWEDPI